jgi:hypothetical protein
MAITETKTVVLAAAEVSDRYSVDVRLRRRRAELTPGEARDFAAELVNAADQAETLQDTDLRANESKLRSELTRKGIN